jgi:hypothetical protein
MLQKLLKLTTFERQQEKQKDYRNVVINQVVIIILGLTISEFLLDGASTPAGKLVATIFAFFGVLYSFLLWDLLRNFTTNNILINVYLFVLLGIVMGGLMVEFPYYKIIHVPDRQLFLLVIHSLLFPIEVTIIGFAIRDIFSGEYLTIDKLWGSACIFLMIAISFGSLYDLISTAKPGSLGAPFELGWANYSECITHSLSIVGGLDPNHPNASRLIRNIGILEAVWSNLFVVLIIGKLMGLPRPPKPGQNSAETL